MIEIDDVCILSIIVVAIVVILLFIIIVYNRFIHLSNNIKKAFSNIDVSLKQRSNEIPNLVNLVKGYMKHEKDTLESLTKARSLILQEENISRKAAASDYISETLKTIFAVAENYPELKASENFLHLQKRISALENEIADRREFYNDSVTIYNIRMQSFPDLLIAKIINLKEKDLFKAKEEDKKYIKINLQN
jgi:LemA protein